MIQQGRNQRALLAEAQSYVARNGMTAVYRGFVSIKACAFLLPCQNDITWFRCPDALHVVSVQYVYVSGLSYWDVNDEIVI